MPGTTVTASTTILSAWANGFTADVAATFNTEWPIALLPTITVAKGGTGATTAALARDNLGLTIGTNVSGVLPGVLFGLTLSNNAADATNDIDIAAGTAVDSTAANVMVLVASITKRIDAAWAVGTGNGGLMSAAALTNTTYHMFLIKRVDTGVVDVGFDASATAPTLPANYTLFRRIGSVIRAAGALVAFLQDGDDFWLVSPVADISATNPGTAAVTRTLSVPIGIKVTAWLLAGGGSGSGNAYYALFSSLDVADTAPSATVHNVVVLTAASTLHRQRVDARTSTAGQIRTRLSASAATDVLSAETIGWKDNRGRLQ